MPVSIVKQFGQNKLPETKPSISGDEICSGGTKAKLYQAK